MSENESNWSDHDPPNSTVFSPFLSRKASEKGGKTLVRWSRKVHSQGKKPLWEAEMAAWGFCVFFFFFFFFFNYKFAASIKKI
jgi:hypothetical protein